MTYEWRLNIGNNNKRINFIPCVMWRQVRTYQCTVAGPDKKVIALEICKWHTWFFYEKQRCWRSNYTRKSDFPVVLSLCRLTLSSLVIFLGPLRVCWHPRNGTRHASPTGGGLGSQEKNQSQGWERARCNSASTHGGISKQRWTSMSSEDDFWPSSIRPRNPRLPRSAPHLGTRRPPPVGSACSYLFLVN